MAFDDAHPLQLSPSNQFNWELWHASPVADNGWALLGETDKWVPTSSDRFVAWSVDASSASVELEGEAGETVVVSFAQGTKRVDVKCVLGQSGRSIASVPAATCVSTQ